MGTRAKLSPHMEHKQEYRYGDFPELFWDAQPEVAIDQRSPVVLSRTISRGSVRAIRALVDSEELRFALPTLPVQPHVRRFWQRVLANLPVISTEG